MSRINNPMEIFKLLNGSNCRECGEKTCLAFAVAVFKNTKPIHACPHLPAEVINRYGGETEKPNTIDEDKAEAVETLKQKISSIDLAETARRIGAFFSNNQLTIKVFGKNFSVDAAGALSSDIHINAWVAFPVLNYILNGSGAAPSGNWITFRELSGGPPRYAHFEQRCEKPLKRVADTYTDLFKDMLEIFDGKQNSGHIDSDV
ncbi:MAG: Fe-S cluster protein, partial [Desulfobacterium sp.]|nr:Fe-S cluster protein [Desulfobacterium sp.]